MVTSKNLPRYLTNPYGIAEAHEKGSNATHHVETYVLHEFSDRPAITCRQTPQGTTPVLTLGLLASCKHCVPTICSFIQQLNAEGHACTHAVLGGGRHQSEQNANTKQSITIILIKNPNS